MRLFIITLLLPIQAFATQPCAFEFVKVHNTIHREVKNDRAPQFVEKSDKAVTIFTTCVTSVPKADTTEELKKIETMFNKALEYRKENRLQELDEELDKIESIYTK